MTAIAEAAALIRRVAGYRKPDESLKAVFLRVARKLSAHLPKYIDPIKPGRVEDIWRAEARMIRSEEMDVLRALAAENKALEEAARDEYRTLVARIDAAERALKEIREAIGLHPENVDRAHLHGVDAAVRGMDSALASGGR